MKLQRLYRKDQNGKITFIDLYTKKDSGLQSYTKYTRTGILGREDKAKTSKVQVKTGKNIGKSNETTPQQQAERELLSEWNLLFNQGYKGDVTQVADSQYNTFADQSLMPMLLNKDKGKFQPCYAQRKYDGVRCIAERHNGEVRIKSREGNVFNIPHILESVTKLMNEQLDQPLDGELYIHGVELHDIISMVSTGDINCKLEYHIYDVPVAQLEFSQRRNLLLALSVDNIPNLKIDYGKPCQTEYDLQLFHEESLLLGYEGTIVCNPTGQYEFGFRTSDKSKIKPRQTDEFECIDQYWNKGKMSNQTTLICKNKEGKTFHVKLKGNNQQREEWARNFDEKVKGKLITIEYRKLSKYNTPIEGVGVAIRDYE